MFIYTIEYFSAIKRMKSCHLCQHELEDIMLNEKIQTWEDTHHMIAVTYGN